NWTLCAHGHKLPPCWTTLYELSKLTDDVIIAAIADGRISPKMQRKNAGALRKPPPTDTEQTSNSRSKSSFAAAWDSAFATADGREEIAVKLDQVGRDGLCQVLSETLRAELRDAVLAQTIQTASASTSSFAVKATNHLHCALRCAEQS